MIAPVPSGPSKQAGGLSMIAEVEHEVFAAILGKMDRPLVLTAHAGFPKAHKYLVHYGGYYFLLKSKEPLDFSQSAEVISTKKIHTGMDGLGL